MPWREVRSLMPISTMPLADRHDVAAFDRRRRGRSSDRYPPDLHLAGEVGMELVDRRRQDRSSCRAGQNSELTLTPP